MISVTVGAEQESPIFTIYIGLNDKDTYQQIIDTDIFSKTITNVCKGYRVSYSSHFLSGGYIHENGTFIHETGAALTLIGLTKEYVNEIAADLCCFLNQESVMVEMHNATYYSVSESIKIEK